MKTLNVVKTKEKIFINGILEEIDISTKDVLMSSINQNSENGFTIEDMMRRLRLLETVEKIKDHDDTVSFEDEDFKYLKQILVSTKWKFISRFILNLVQSAEKL